MFRQFLAKLTLAALLLYPFGTKEGTRRHPLNDVPFDRFRLATYPSVEFAEFGAPGLGSGLMGTLGL